MHFPTGNIILSQVDIPRLFFGNVYIFIFLIDDISLVGLHCRQESGLTFSMLLILLPLLYSLKCYLY